MNNILNIIYDKVEDFVIDNNNAYIKRADFGFVNTDCDFVKNIIITMCLHAAENPDIFNEIQSNNIIKQREPVLYYGPLQKPSLSDSKT